jgi:lipopolysaccharide export system permease protein
MKKLIFKQFYFELIKNFITFLSVISIIVWTLQSVNYFDFVTNDGHGIKVYFSYAILNLPKIIHRLVPFVFFISLFYTILSYEKKNELDIFWLHGIKKSYFMNNIIKITIFLILAQILIGTFIVPKSQQMARQFLKYSSLEFFTTLIKAGKFLNVTKNLTIYIEKENENKSFENIFLEDKRENLKLIYAKKGLIVNEGNNKIFKLLDGNVIDNSNSKIKVFKFDQINFDLNEIKTKTITTPKIQEIDTYNLILCLYRDKTLLDEFQCKKDIKPEINQQIFKRLLKPFYLFLIALTCSCLIIKSKFSNGYIKFRSILFLLGFLILLLSEVSVRYVSFSSMAIFFNILVPIIILSLIYMFFLKRINNV